VWLTSRSLSRDERLDERREEIDGEGCLDARGVLQEHRCDLVHGFQLLEAPFEPRLSPVSFEDLLWCERAVIGYEAVHAIGLLVVGDGGGGFAASQAPQTWMADVDTSQRAPWRHRGHCACQIALDFLSSFFFRIKGF
jgi:hypothetical protein